MALNITFRQVLIEPVAEETASLRILFQIPVKKTTKRTVVAVEMEQKNTQ
jgi:hypothetical protein